MQPELFNKINGYSLQFFGWGGEDDDMGDRSGLSRFQLTTCKKLMQLPVVFRLTETTSGTLHITIMCSI